MDKTKNKINEYCIKCGYTGARYEYIDPCKKAFGECCEDAYIMLTCERCGYSWRVDTIDKRGKNETKLCKYADS